MNMVAIVAGLMLAVLSHAASAATFYVDSAVWSSGDGTSWAGAWKGFSSINWSRIRAGDTIYISGGSSSKIYTGALVVGASGTSDSPITITSGVDSGHNGNVLIDGRNSRSWGVRIENRNHVAISRLNVRNHTGAGFRVRFATAGVVVQDNDVYTGDGRGLDFRSNRGLNSATARNNRITTPSNTSGETDGIWSSDNDGVVFESNRIIISNSNTNGHSDGIQSFLDYRVTIRNNLIEQANSAKINNHGMWLSNTRDGGVLRVYNNVVLTPNLAGDSAVTHWAEPSWGEDGTARFRNNIIRGGRRALNLDKTPSTEIKNNILLPAPGGYAVYMVNGHIVASNVDSNLIWAPGAAVSNRASSWAGWRLLGYDANGINTDPSRFGVLVSPVDEVTRDSIGP